MKSILLIVASLWTQDAAVQAKRALETTRAQKSITAGFKAEIRVPDSAPLLIEGTSVWIRPNILFLHYKASGGDEVRIVRVGEKVRLYHPVVEDWVSADEAGRPMAGRGVQNPDDVLSGMQKVADKAKPIGKEKVGDRECDILEFTLTGDDMAKVMKELAGQGTFDLAQSNSTVRIFVGSDHLLYRVTIAAQLAPIDPALKGKKADYKADVIVKAYNRDFAMDFSILDREQKATPIPLSEEILTGIEQTKDIPDELKAEIRKRKDSRGK